MAVGNYPPSLGRGGYGGNNIRNFSQNKAFINGKRVLNPTITAAICQICFKPKHTSAECRNRYNIDYVPSYNPYHSSSRASYLTTLERTMVDQGWYIDSSTTHNLTNNL